MNNISSKDFFRNYGLMIFLVIVIIGILIPMTFLSNGSWTKGLRVSVENVLNETDSDWIVNDNIEITSPMTTNAAAYKVFNSKTKEEAEAVILRITTLYGPQAAVFVYHQDETVTFQGYSSLHGRIAKQISQRGFDKRVDYWQQKVPEILGK